jgi:hypothetical protein
MKTVLTEEYKKIENMKDDINKESWRKVAGELLSNEMEENVDRLLQRSRAIPVRLIDPGDVEETNLAVL